MATLGQSGARVARTHIDARAVKTDAPFSAAVDAAREVDEHRRRAREAKARAKAAAAAGASAAAAAVILAQNPTSNASPSHLTRTQIRTLGRRGR